MKYVATHLLCLAAGILLALLAGPLLFSSPLSHDQPRLFRGNSTSGTDPRVRLGVVATVSIEFAQTFAREIAAMNCYCALHGFGYHLELLNPLPQRHIFQGRLQVGSAGAGAGGGDEDKPAREPNLAS